jgi:hypothetical protein
MGGTALPQHRRLPFAIGLLVGAQVAALAIALLLHAYARLEPMRYTLLFSFLYVNSNALLTTLVFALTRLDPRRPGVGVRGVTRVALVSFAGSGSAFEIVSEIIRRWIKPDFLPFASAWHLELLATTLGFCVAGAVIWTFYLRLRTQLDVRAAETDALCQALAQRPSTAAAAPPFVVRRRDGAELIPEPEVVYFAAEDKYVFLCTEQERFFYDATLKELETRLNASAFLRVHRRFIVALSRVRRLHRGVWGDLDIELDVEPPLRLPVGRAYRAKVRAHLGL